MAFPVPAVDAFAETSATPVRLALRFTQLLTQVLKQQGFILLNRILQGLDFISARNWAKVEIAFVGKDDTKLRGFSIHAVQRAGISTCA